MAKNALNLIEICQKQPAFDVILPCLPCVEICVSVSTTKHCYPNSVEFSSAFWQLIYNGVKVKAPVKQADFIRA